MEHATLEFDAVGTPVGASRLWATARDWARFGMLYQHDGVVGRERILPAGWLDYFAILTPSREYARYGAGFWTNRADTGGARNRTAAGMPRDAFMARGTDGQYVIVMSSHDLVIALRPLAGPRWRYRHRRAPRGRDRRGAACGPAQAPCVVADRRRNEKTAQRVADAPSLTELRLLTAYVTPAAVRAAARTHARSTVQLYFGLRDRATAPGASFTGAPKVTGRAWLCTTCSTGFSSFGHDGSLTAASHPYPVAYPAQATSDK